MVVKRGERNLVYVLRYCCGVCRDDDEGLVCDYSLSEESRRDIGRCSASGRNVHGLGQTLFPINGNTIGH